MDIATARAAIATAVRLMDAAIPRAAIAPIAPNIARMGGASALLNKMTHAGVSIA